MFREVGNMNRIPIRKRNKNTETEDRKLSLFVVAFFLTSALNMSIKTIFPIPQKWWGLISAFFMLVLVGVMIFALPIILYRDWKKFFVTEGVFVVLYVISLIAGNAQKALLFRMAFWTLGVSIPLAFAVYVLYDKRMLLQMLHVSAYIQCVPLWLTLYYMRQTGGYSMSASYSLVLPVLICLFYFFEKHKTFDLIVAVISAFLILFFGARGPLICIAFYVVLQMLIFMKNRNLKKILWFLFLFAMSAIVVFYSHILQWVENLLIRFDISSYILRRLLSGELFTSTGRDYLREYYLGLVSERPFWGWGIFGGWLGEGEGPHNMLLEIILAFGIPMGILICMFACFLMIKLIFLKRCEHTDLTVIFASYNIVLFFVSGNWLEKPQWFIFVILCLSARSKIRMKWS